MGCAGSKRTLRSAGNKGVAVLFDFDGTIGNTETPAMEIAFWELAPYMDVEAKKLHELKAPWMQENAGKAFEFMIENVEEERKKKGLPAIEEVRKAKSEDKDVIEVVNAARKDRFELPPLHETKYESVLVMQKEETVQALKKLATPCEGIPEVLKTLTESKIPFCICTTSGKPRVPECVVAMKFENYFPPEKIHSGESDFTPSRFKPAPDVYKKGADTEGYAYEDCVAIEDSASGVGSAANAKLGFIIGYVGATHIPESKKTGHADKLLSGLKSKDGRGANIVIWNMLDAVPLINYFLSVREKSETVPPGTVPEELTKQLKYKFRLGDKKV
mmetsp:Transcript_24234/g.36344  ORF Transcript_24234/g.36344 Transcript_24234/m.36344 type:complete len:331 (-) Transcript_24234:121-1113(-)